MIPSRQGGWRHRKPGMASATLGCLPWVKPQVAPRRPSGRSLLLALLHEMAVTAVVSMAARAKWQDHAACSGHPKRHEGTQSCNPTP